MLNDVDDEKRSKLSFFWEISFQHLRLRIQLASSLTGSSTGADITTSHVLDGLAYYKVRSATLCITRSSMQLARVAFKPWNFSGNFSRVRCSQVAVFFLLL